MAGLTLGLDLGPNSIGWALINEQDEEIVDLGVRVFPEGVDNFDTKKETSRNEERRIARGMRRQTKRRARRKRRLREALVLSGLFPNDVAEQDELYQLNPYELRSRALDEKLTPHEIGRVLLHLNQRRGFKSNKKEEARAEAKAKRKKVESKPKPEAEKKTEDILLEMAELQRAIASSDARTLGEYLFRKQKSFNHQNRQEDDHIRGRHTLRKMMMNEFDLIWKRQSTFYPNLLTERLAFGKLGRQKDIHRPISKCDDERKALSDLESFGLFGLIFFHRTLKPVPKDVIGLCKLEPKQRRCARADRRAQRFRLLQELNNLRFIDPDLNEECRLEEGQREMLLEYMSVREKATFDDLRKKLGFLETVKFNLERGKRSGIKGMEVDWLMAKAVGKQWHKLPKETKDCVVDALVHNLDEDETHERLVNEFGLTSDEADAALSVDLPDGYVKLSLMAIENLIPHMKRGLVYEHSDPAQSARAAAGYDEPWAFQKRVFDSLPDPRRTRECPIGDIPNPVVKRTLVELRKVVNAIIREHGRPDEIHVEMGRDVKTRPKDQRSPAYWKYRQEEEERAEREARRTAAKNKLRELGIPYGAAGRNILKYLLWDEQGGACAYSYPTKMIGLNQLFTEQIQIDHILPAPGVDDSPMNKVVCFQSENHGATGKGQQTPRQWLESAYPEKWQEVLQRAKKLPYPKYKRFLRKDFKMDDFIERQLNDTRYIAKATVQYLKSLFDLDESKSGAVLGLKGQQTSTLRRLWGLDTVLSEIPDSPAWQEQSELRAWEKNRADHRHHVIDAIVLALTDHRRLQQLARGFTVEQFPDIDNSGTAFKTVFRGGPIDPPWKGLRDEVERLLRQLDGRQGDDGERRGVSHRPRRKVGFALHKDKPFGVIRKPGGETKWAKRKSLTELSASEILDIGDDAIRSIVLQHLNDARIEIAKAAAKRGRPKVFFRDLNSGEETEAAHILHNVCMPSSGRPIKKVRLHIPNQTILPIRERKAAKAIDKSQVAYVDTDELHHVCLFQWTEGDSIKRDAVFVSQLEAMKRLSRQQQQLSDLVKQWKKEGWSTREIENHKAAAMRDVAKAAPIIQSDASGLNEEAAARIPPGAEFVFSLSTGDVVLVEMNGRERLKVVNKLVSTQGGRVHLVDVLDVRRRKKDIGTTPNSLLERYKARKVTVDPIGRVRWAEGSAPSDHSIGTINPRVLEIAQQSVDCNHSNTQARKELKKAGLKHLGGQLSAALRHYKKTSKINQSHPARQ